MAQSPRPNSLTFNLRLAAAWAAIGWERLWRAAWPGLAVIGVFLVAALFDLASILPGWLHLLLLVVFLCGLAFGVWRGFRGFQLPRIEDARRRLEVASELEHRPIEHLTDQQATGTGDAGARALWEAHRKRMLERLGDLRTGWPKPGLAARDPLALRGALIVLLVLGVVVSWGDGMNRIWRASTPVLAGAANAGPTTLEVWLTPPAYTRQAPRFLDRKTRPGEPIAVPDGTKYLVRVQGGRGAPRLEIGEARPKFKEMAGGAFQSTGKLARTGRLIVTQRGRELGRWAVNVVRDKAPSIGFRKPPAATARQALRVEFEARDDHGVKAVRMIIRRWQPGSAVLGKPFVVKLPAGGERKLIKGASFHDLTAHRWAGLPVTVQLEAEDAIGQKGRSAPFRTVLPERKFRHPVARALAEARKDLIRDPSNRDVVAETVGDLSLRPDRFNNDVVAFMAMRTARARLFMDKSQKALDEVAKLLWDTALRIEDGRLSLAERDLRDAQRALQDALNRDKLGDKEIQRLVEQLRKAIDKFMRQLAEDMRKNPEKYRQGQTPLDRNAMVLERRDLQQMLKRMQDLARSGNKQAAQQMLQMLRRMLENLQGMARAQRGRRGQHPGAKIMRDLQNLIQRQQRLMDKTFRESQRRRGTQGQQRPGRPGQRPGQRQGQQGQGQKPGQGMQGFAGEQEALRRGLGSIMRRMDELMGRIPGQLGRAEREMRGAGDALRGNRPGRAVPPQGRALRHLRQGGRQAMRQMMQRFGNQMGLMRGRPGWRRGSRRDPFGRPPDGTGGADTSTVKIPKASDVQRAREILDELRRRAGERERPKIERDYIDRLLRQF